MCNKLRCRCIYFCWCCVIIAFGFFFALHYWHRCDFAFNGVTLFHPIFFSFGSTFAVCVLCVMLHAPCVRSVQVLIAWQHDIYDNYIIFIYRKIRNNNCEIWCSIVTVPSVHIGDDIAHWTFTVKFTKWKCEIIVFIRTQLTHKKFRFSVCKRLSVKVELMVRSVSAAINVEIPLFSNWLAKFGKRWPHLILKQWRFYFLRFFNGRLVESAPKLLSSAEI